MRATILSRTVVAVASFAVGSVALAAAPAGAAPSEVTRAEVLAAAAEVRALPPTAAAPRSLQALAEKACSVDTASGGYVYGVGRSAVQPGQGVDGLVAHANVYNGSYQFVHVCSFGVVASTTGSSRLSGTARLDTGTVPLSGEVTVTPPIFYQTNERTLPAFQATGQATKTQKVTTKKKTSKQKKYAKKKYVKRIKTAKKSYAKALKRAGGSTSKKATAKKAYRWKRSVAKARYKKSVVSYKMVTTRTAFDVSARTAP